MPLHIRVATARRLSIGCRAIRPRGGGELPAGGAEPNPSVPPGRFHRQISDLRLSCKRLILKYNAGVLQHWPTAIRHVRRTRFCGAPDF